MQKNKKWLWAFLLLASGTIQSSAYARAPAKPAGIPPAINPVATPVTATPVTATATAPVAESAAAHALSAADVETWLDGYVPYALHSGDIAGAVVAVVKNGEVLFEHGYGYADYDKRVSVDAKLTLFRWGSVSKLLTWTAVMQLVEQGKLNLDADVNQYLDFKIPPREGKPVTLRNIMTHTGGFEERLKGLIGVESDGVMPLDQFVKLYIPTRIFAPGETPAYSNTATAIAGYIVARVSGVPFDDYIDKHVFEPLQMQNSTFRQPLPAALKPNVSNGYRVASLPPKAFEIVGPAPAGSLSASGDDMTRFMIAHLQKGRFGSAQILKEETAEQMHNTALTILPRVNRMELGFYEDNYNGHRVIAHGGDTQWFHSDLHLFIDDGVGLLISMNSVGKDGAAQEVRSQLFHEFADRAGTACRAVSIRASSACCTWRSRRRSSTTATARYRCPRRPVHRRFRSSGVRSLLLFGGRSMARICSRRGWRMAASCALRLAKHRHSSNTCERPGKNRRDGGHPPWR
jgi:CubicO group peptidase (beta-lactamase class C family)